MGKSVAYTMRPGPTASSAIWSTVGVHHHGRVEVHVFQVRHYADRPLHLVGEVAAPAVGQDETRTGVTPA